MDAPVMYGALNVIGLAGMQADQMREEQAETAALSGQRHCDRQAGPQHLSECASRRRNIEDQAGSLPP